MEFDYIKEEIISLLKGHILLLKDKIDFAQFGEKEKTKHALQEYKKYAQEIVEKLNELEKEDEYDF